MHLHVFYLRPVFASAFYVRLLRPASLKASVHWASEATLLFDIQLILFSQQPFHHLATTTVSLFEMVPKPPFRPAK